MTREVRRRYRPAMGERPSTELTGRQRLAAVVLGAVVGMVFVLSVVLDLGVVEIALILGPLLVVGAPAVGYALWARRRGGDQPPQPQ